MGIAAHKPGESPYHGEFCAVEQSRMAMPDMIMSSPAPNGNGKGRVLFASLVGTTIEFFDFYVYATAAVLVFPTLFFPNSDPTTALLASFATFSIAFFANLLSMMSCSVTPP